MAQQTLNPWLADLITEEIGAICTWQANKHAGIKAENPYRFRNDGSNFRSTISETEPGRSEVQLIEIHGEAGSTGGILCVLSDGVTLLKARLVKSVVDLLEGTMNLSALEGYKVNKKGKVLDEEGDVIGELVSGDLLDCVRQKVNAIGEVLDDVGKVVGNVQLAAASLPKLGEKDIGHVVRLKKFVIVTTGFGLHEDWIKLVVEEVEYLFHRSRKLGQPTPIEQDSKIRPFLPDRVNALLNYNPEGQDEVGDGDGEDAEEENDLPSQPLQHDDPSVAVMRSSPPSMPASPLPQSRLGRVAAASLKRSRAQHTLEEDGFEARAGVNLQGPVKAQRESPDLLGLLKNKRAKRSQPDVQRQEEAIAETPARRTHGQGSQAHGLFAGAENVRIESARDSPERRSVDNSPRLSEASRTNVSVRERSPVDIVPTEVQASLQSTPRPETQQARTPRPEAPRSRSLLKPEDFSYPRPNAPKPESPQAGTPAAGTPEDKHADLGYSRLFAAEFGYSREFAAAVSPRGSKQPTISKPTRKPRIPYGRRKIPANQQLLLDKDSSWLPPLPGGRFPEPNVPIELLTKWNTAPSLSQRPASQKSMAGSSREMASPSQNPRSSQRSQRPPASPKEEPSSSESSSDEAEDSEDEDMVPEADWPPTQSPHQSSPVQSSPVHSSPLQSSPPRSSPPRPPPRPAVPPDSSLHSVIRGTPDLVVEAPRVLKQKSVQQVPARPQNIQRHPLPSRPAGPLPPESDLTMIDPPPSLPTKPSPRANPSSRAQQSSSAFPPTERPSAPGLRLTGRTATSPPTGPRNTAPPTAPHASNSARSSQSTSNGRYYTPQQAPSSPALSPGQAYQNARRAFKEERRENKR